MMLEFICYSIKYMQDIVFIKPIIFMSTCYKIRPNLKPKNFCMSELQRIKILIKNIFEENFRR